MTRFLSVPVVDINRDNFKQFWPSVVFACKTASFIALDAELSGLGPRKQLVAKNLPERYKAICDVAKTRAVLSLGVSCYQYKPPLPDQAVRKKANFAVQTYNITTLCNEDYMVEPAALQFLVEHGFDFNKQYSKGVTYHPGQDKDNDGTEISIRNLFGEILMSGTPVVVHNGLVDMTFLYHHFYTTLPPSYSQFVGDLSEMYQGGIFDTKYLAEFVVRMPSSYLEYVFRKCQRDNLKSEEEGGKFFTLTFQEYLEGSFVEYHPCFLPERKISDPSSEKKICQLYWAHGFCNQATCDGTHNLDIILDADLEQEEQKKRRRRRKRKRKKRGQSEMVDESEGDTEMLEETEQDISVASPEKISIEKEELSGEGRNVEGSIICKDNGIDEAIKESKREQINGKLPRQHGSHRAGFDAFMTGFAMACVISKRGHFPSNEQTEKKHLAMFGLNGEANKLFLSGKNIPMLVTKSSFAKPSQAHKEKMKRLMEQHSR
ncbi:Target of EGR1 protein 1 [Holothuria leucospilota]|uniref:Target of EGR1 protein 1 n=1 Tax=Holothuria leucospilota TaxID=206669 RepID=A0A9Q1C8Y0_HOLLE|nr:Target of EGR1 protein 1 [Holothuria leucospilota]